MAIIWKSLPLNLPIDNAICWVRINYWFGQPFKARFLASTQTWTSVVSSINYPAWSVSRWRYL